MQNTRSVTLRQICLRLMKYIAPYWDAFVLGLSGMIAMAATVPMLAALVQPTLDSVIFNKNRELLQLVLLGVIGLFTLRGVAGHIGVYAINWVSSKLVMDLRIEIFNKLSVLPAPYYASHFSSSLASRVTSDTARIARAFTDAVTVTVKDMFTILGLMGWMLFLNWALALLALFMALVILLLMRLIRKRLQEMELGARQTAEGFARALKDFLENYMVVKLHGGEQYEKRRMREQAEGMHRFTARRMAIAALSVPLIQIATAIAVAVIVYVAAQQAAADEITAGAFASFVAAMLMLIAPVKRIAAVKELLQPGLIAAESIFSLLDQAAEPDTGTIALERARGELRFEHVSFRHGREKNFEATLKTSVVRDVPPRDGGRLALHDLTLTVQPGETVALVGFSGSTAALASLVSGLVSRFIDPGSGKILMDGHDIKCLKLASLRANIGLVSPETTLFRDTIAANIAYGGMGRATEATITAAAKTAHATEFIRKMPEGLQTLVGEQGVITLTGGQRLRIAVARALLKNPPILILDDSAETIETESTHVQAALDAIMQERTTLVITNRLSTVEKADHVILLDKGTVVETGNHRELLARSGAYAGLARTLFMPKAAVVNHSELSRPVKSKSMH